MEDSSLKQVVIFPTETFFGLGSDPRNEAAISLLLKLKQRDESIPLIISSADKLDEIIEEDSPHRRKLQESFWPGPLTLVFKAKPVFDKRIYGPGGTLAVRLSSNQVARDLADSLGGFVTSTSANPAGKYPAKTAEEAKAYFPGLSVVAGELGSEELPSTIVSLVEAEPKVFREGAVSAEQIEQALAS